MRWRRCGYALAFLLVPLAGLPALEVDGSLFAQAGPAPAREALQGTVPDWNGTLQVSTRLRGAGPSAEMAMEALLAHDVAASTDTLYLEEAWAGWKPWDGLSLRLGRQRLGFGCGLAWSVVDDLDPQPMPFDTHAPRVGLDALRLSADFASLGVPVQASMETFAPRTPGTIALNGGSAGSLTRIEDLGAAAQVSAFLDIVEVGAALSVSRLAAEPPVSVGGWSTIDLGGFVIGAEGVWRREAVELLLNFNKRLGDFGVMAETRWVPDQSRVWVFGELSWSKGELSTSLAALFALRAANGPGTGDEPSGLVDLSVSYAASEALVLSATGTVYEKPGELPEIGPLSQRWAVTVGVEYFF